jgi:tRNA (guanine26-N2/guanine27-N2)-dimethyltransferase
LEFGGPLWTDALSEPEFIDELLAANKINRLEDAAEIGKLLELLRSENGFPAGFFDLHALAKKQHIQVRGLEHVSGKLEAKGFRVSRTHFAPTALKTDAKAKDVFAALK